MLNCDICDYYKVLNPETKGREVAVCDLTDVIFSRPVAELDMEYPCRNVVYGECQCKQQRDIHSVRHFENDDWRLIYKRPHLPIYTQRSYVRA